MLSIIIAIISSASIGSIITHLINRRKNNADAIGAELINVQSLLNISQQTMLDLKAAWEEIKKLNKQVQEVTEANMKLHCEIEVLRRELKKYSNAGK